MRLFKTLVSSVLLAGCSVVGVRAVTDEPKYALVGRLDGGVEVRTYDSRTAAETTVAARGGSSNEGRAFSLLAGYIFGGNKSNDSIAMTTPVEAASRSTKIAMTTPVQAASATGSYQMRFSSPQGTMPKVRPFPTIAACGWSICRKKPWPRCAFRGRATMTLSTSTKQNF